MDHSEAVLTSPHGRAPNVDRSGERGVALVMAIMFTIIVVGITVTGALTLRAHQAKTRVSFVTHGQAVQFSKSGLIEALGWLRKQTSQPVTTFAPVLDMGVAPPIMDTIDSGIGIVREFEITNSIWGRYEVWKQWDADPNATRLAWRQQMQCEDISDLRGDLAPGSVWRLRSIGYVFRRVDPNAAFNEAPNQVLGQDMTEVETRRLALQPPGQAALCTRTGSTTQVLTRGKIVGGSLGAGVFYRQGTGSITVSGTGASISGTPSQSASSTYDDTFEVVFGVSQSELAAMADYYVTSSADFPSPVPIDKVVQIGRAHV